MGLKYIESFNTMTHILSAYRFKKEIVNGEYQYGYIFFYEHSHKQELEIDGNIEYAWDGGGGIKESYILTDHEFKWLLEFEHRVSMSPTYVDAFWKAYGWDDKFGYQQLTKEEFFYHFNKYYHLTLKQ